MNKYWRWLKSLFIHYYEITVSFDTEYGNNDDKHFIAKKILIQKEKHLKFVDEDNKTVEYRSSGGLNFIIEDWHGTEEI